MEIEYLQLQTAFTLSSVYILRCCYNERKFTSGEVGGKKNQEPSDGLEILEQTFESFITSLLPGIIIYMED